MCTALSEYSPNMGLTVLGNRSYGLDMEPWLLALLIFLFICKTCGRLSPAMGDEGFDLLVQFKTMHEERRSTLQCSRL